MGKYRLLRDRIVCNPYHQDDVLLVPNPASTQQLSLAHDTHYVQRVLLGQLTPAEIKRIGFPWSEEMVERSRRSCGATLAAARTALSEGLAVNLAGGTHHAMRDAGEGFCVFNDAAVAILTLLDEKRIRRALVVDCDVHQGNGTAQILNAFPNVYTFSMHGEKNFPLRKFPSTLDVDLSDGTNDDQYLQILKESLTKILEQNEFDLAVYLAGADPFEGDRLGRLKLTKLGLSRRDEYVLKSLRSCSIPTAIAMAGGYAHNLNDIVDIHAETIRIASAISKQSNFTYESK